MNTHRQPSTSIRLGRNILIVSSFALLVGCAHNPPTELVNARTVYDRAAGGDTKEYAPAELHIAKSSLIEAERSFDNKEDQMIVRDQSYIAMRQVELAESVARTIMYERGIDASQTREGALKDKDAARTKAELAATQGALSDEQKAGAATAEQLAAEQKLRAEAEKRAAQAAADLARIASVKQDERGTVITLSGSVLFASNKHVLLPAAEAKLSQVANALLAGDPAATFVVEGHTDSQGKNEANQTLSVNRANAVRDYLVSHEIASDRITAQGFGEDRAIADNGSAEGRANNRRVEIVVKNGK